MKLCKNKLKGKVKMWKFKKRLSYLIFFPLVLLASILQAETKLLGQPDISKEKITFIYAGDIWLTDIDGRFPQRLTSTSAEEAQPHFSPDGQWIAFTANHDNNQDVYLMSVAGGQAKRLTWHPEADIVNGWSADGKRILFTSKREMKSGRSSQIWEIDSQGGFPQKIMQAVVQSAKWSSDGKTLAYQPYNTAHRGASGWRNHRGGSTPPIWILRPSDSSYQEIPHVNASDTNPLWIGDNVYFLSDRDRTRNLYKYTTKTQQVLQITHEKIWEIISANTDGKNIVFEVAGGLKILDSQTNQIIELSININPDVAELRVQWKDAMKSLESIKLSTSGKRALISARGEIFTLPLDKGSTRNLTKTSGVRERDALWSPLGKKIAYTSDKSGDQQLIIVDQTGKQSNKAYSLGETADYQLLLWGGKGKHIIYMDNHLGLWAINPKNGKRNRIDTDNRRNGFQVSQSADGRWLAYTKTGANHLSDIFIYDFKRRASHKLTDSMSSSNNPVFSPDGKFLYFMASTNAGVTAVGLDMTTQERPRRYGIYAAVLAKDGKSPLLPKSDEELSYGVNPSSDKTDDSKDTKEVVVKLDIKGLPERIVALPIAQKSYHSLAIANVGNLYYIETNQAGSSILADGKALQTSQLNRFDFEDKKAENLLDDVEQFELSADGKVLLTISQKQELNTAVIGKKLELKKLNTSDVKAKIDPRLEWQQIFNEVWRAERDYFYADNMHGLNWQAVGQRFKKLLPHVSRRADLNKLMVEMIAQMEVGHNRVFGGDISKEKQINVGLLGADLIVVNNLYQINKIYTGEKWNPSLKAPLSAPGIGAKAGDTIHSVNGTKLTGKMNVFSLFENTVGQQVTLMVSQNGRIKDAKKVVVEPIANDSQLRFWAWVEGNRKQVDKLTDGEVGYVYLPNTAGAGYTFFNRMFFAQSDKKAVIIDVRRNGGGQAANYITDILSRQYLASWKDRDGLIFDTPGSAIYGPKVMLIDQDAGSGGDFLPYSFKRMGIGKLIGKRTWGGLIGIAANRPTIDGGQVLVPYFRFFTPDNEWRIENEGVSPDIDVTLNPILVNQGRDSQLEAGIKQALFELKNYRPIKLHKAPPLPTKVGE